MKVSWFCLFAGLLGLCVAVEGADWPQWQGPDRTNISKETGLLKTWPKDGPKLLWTYSDAGVGYSAPAIVGDKLYIMGARQGREHLFCLDVKNGGKQLWTADIGQQFKNGYGDGPRGTPTVDGNLVFGLGGQGNLVCLSTDGKPVWSKNMQKDFGGKMMSGWGYSESPLVDGDKLVCMPGGGKGTVAALDKKTGKLLWQSAQLKDDAAYSSLIAADIDGVRQYILTTGKGVAGISAKDGSQLWYYARSDFRTAVAPTPIYSDGQVFTTAGYGAKGVLLKIAAKKADEVWSTKDMENHHGGVVLVDGYLYGTSGNSNSAKSPWRCVEFKSGKTAWTETKLGPGSLTCAGGQLYLYSLDNGTCVLLDPDPKGWKEQGRFKIPRESKLPRGQGHIWTHPVVANGRLYLRDLDLLFCFDVKGGTAEANPADVSRPAAFGD